MKYLFFDLETTDLNFTGQILQYSFVLTDTLFNVVDRLDGTITLSRTQIPNPEAIYATDIDIDEHLHLQEHVEDTPEGMFLRNFKERDSLNIIREWIEEKCIRERIYFVGHNSTNFDVPYLRTSMVRNGVNPYFNNNLVYVDTKNLHKMLYLKSEEFKNLIHSQKSNPKKPFSLENLSNILEVTKTEQTHQAWDDVDLLIDLCKKSQEKFNLYVENDSTFMEFNSKSFGYMVDFDYGDNGLIGTKKSLVAYHKELSFGKYYFFIDVSKALELYEPNKTYTIDEIREILIWKKVSGSFFYIEELKTPELNTEQISYIEEIKISPKVWNMTMEDYFPNKLCDIEQHIYMMEYSGLNQLVNAIDEFDKHRRVYTQPTDIYAKKLLTRYKLNNLINDSEENFRKIFKLYSEYRYSYPSVSPNRMIVDRFTVNDKDLIQDSFHRSIDDYIEKIHELCQIAGGKNYKIKLMLKLHNYINNFCEKYLNE
jgi:hypothetical protein